MIVYGVAVEFFALSFRYNTQDKHMTMVLYQNSCTRESVCRILDNPVTITSAQHAGAKASETVDAPTAEDDTADEELVDKFNPSSDAEIEETTYESAPVLQGTLQGEIGSTASFPLGARSRFGRVIRFNNHLLY
ncbi:hypothetical protein AWC38_SpisGene9606 [Stylophora pistillata]|uniref:Uncharacterized protein n=1 Tax=Stylophora pistillata TaxID=50429 RepID=A0A2B4SB08_STYPI|nr:hypothetical protein AWC38_SpisGene9606 [Stylophora pistillata]